ncbi:MAG: biotin/lipoyl-binding protein [Bacteroidetes bacterium]|jgi:biotin carboxyl carrier protein|nr:biotin/lipoyl-binding protein [Bacteroidota bacterium]
MNWEVRWPDGRVEQITPESGDPWDWKPVGRNVYDVRMGARNVRVEKLDGPDSKGFVRIRINGVEQSLQVLDGQQILLESLGMNDSTEAVENHVEAPMPGKVLEVKVSAGDEVAAGDPLVVLEAMKMENVLRAPRDGFIDKVNLTVGEAVDKGAILVTYEMK